MSDRTFSRLFSHLFTPDWWAYRLFGPGVQETIGEAVRVSEQSHRGELRFVIEGALHPFAAMRGVTPRERAVELFGRLGIWDTAENSGVLIYVQCVDRRIEIIADRGIRARVAQSEWDDVCRRMEQAFAAGLPEAGALAAIRDITVLLARHFPARDGEPNTDELPDKPLLL